MKNTFVIGLGLAMALMAAGCSKSKTPSSGGEAPSITSAAPEGGSGEAVPMKIKWIVGKRYAQQMTMVQIGHHEAPGGEKAIEQQMTMVQEFNIDAVKALPDGGTELRLEFTSQKMDSMIGDVKSIAFDSKADPKSDEANPAAPILRKMIGAHLLYDLDKDGKVEKIVGLDEFYSQISGADPKAKGMIKNMMNEDSLKKMAMRGLGLPENPARVGDHWPVALDMSVGAIGTLKLNLNYTFKGWDTRDGKKCALLHYTGTMSTAPAPQEKSVGFTLDNATIAGDTWFDPALSMVVDTSSEQNMILKLTSQEKTMSSKMTQKVDTKMTQVTDLPK